MCELLGVLKRGEANIQETQAHSSGSGDSWEQQDKPETSPSAGGKSSLGTTVNLQSATAQKATELTESKTGSRDKVSSRGFVYKPFPMSSLPFLSLISVARSLSDVGFVQRKPEVWVEKLFEGRALDRPQCSCQRFVSFNDRGILVFHLIMMTKTWLLCAAQK